MCISFFANVIAYFFYILLHFCRMSGACWPLLSIKGTNVSRDRITGPHIRRLPYTVCWNVGFLCRKLRCYWDEIRWQSACWYEWMYVCATGCTRIRPADGVDDSFADAVSARQHWLALHTSCNRSTENARPENGGPKRDEKRKMCDLNAGTNVRGGKRGTWKCLNSG